MEKAGGSAILTFAGQMITSSSIGRPAYACINWSWTISVAVEIHSLSQFASRKYSSLCCGCKTVHQKVKSEYDQKNSTHSWLFCRLLCDLSRRSICLDGLFRVPVKHEELAI